MKYIDADKLVKFKEALADIIVSSQGICTYQDCKDIAEREALLLIASLQQGATGYGFGEALDEYYEIADFWPSEAIEYEIHKDIAHHFYELGLNARKEK